MIVKQKNIFLPKKGKNQLKLSRFSFNPNYRDNIITLYLPCAKDKPYYKSSTHQYVKLKLREYIPKIWLKMVHICTISEVIGIIPEKLENIIFNFYRNEALYEHYPSYDEGDLERTSNWLKEYINTYGTKFNYGYCTSKIFRNICHNVNLKCFPEEFDKRLALFEFRKNENIKELTNKIFRTYKELLISRVKKWKKLNSHPYMVLLFSKENQPFDFSQFKSRFRHLKNPKANIETFCHESKSDKGIFFQYNNIKKKYFIPNFILKFLNI